MLCCEDIFLYNVPARNQQKVGGCRKGILMFNMENVGRKIAELRKNRNMTQLELADRMGISFQAVSNWERGNSMPDISKLPELAELFNVTIDELLGEDSIAVKSIVNGDIKEYLEESENAFEELSSIAPMLRPDQIDEVLENKETDDLREIEDLLPFVSKKVVDDIAVKAAEEGRYQDLDIVAPFASGNIVNDIARKMIAENKNIADIAPFVSREVIGELADVLYHKSGLRALEDIAPFIPKEQLGQIAQQEYESNGLCHFEAIAPFLDRAYLNELAQKAIQKDGIKAISTLAPFLDRDMLSEYVKEKYLS